MSLGDRERIVDWPSSGKCRLAIDPIGRGIEPPSPQSAEICEGGFHGAHVPARDDPVPDRDAKAAIESQGRVVGRLDLPAGGYFHTHGNLRNSQHQKTSEAGPPRSLHDEDIVDTKNVPAIPDGKIDRIGDKTK
jgi:hypothetical protein